MTINESVCLHDEGGAKHGGKKLLDLPFGGRGKVVAMIIAEKEKPMCGNHHHDHASSNHDEAVSGAKFKVRDMTCGHCENTIRSALAKNLPGAAVAINLEKHEVTVDADPAIAGAAIREAGYEPHLLF